MKKFVISLALGMFFGLLDIIPMIIRRLNPVFIISAFLLWTIVGVLYSMIALEINLYLRSLIIISCVLIPSLPLIYLLDKASIPIIIATSLIFSLCLAFMSKKLGIVSF